MQPEFWRGTRVFITGHTGFKGAWLSLWLQRAGAQVTGFALDPPTEPSLFAAAGVSRGMWSYRGDVRDLGALRRVVSAHAPDVIIHMAAQSVVRRSYREPVETYSTNVMGTVNVLEAARAWKNPCAVVVVTSDKCYEPHADGAPHTERDRLGGRDPYANSKGCAELVSAAYRQSYDVPVATVRAGNAIGGGDWTEDQLIPDLVRAALAGTPALLRNPTAVRPWQFVLEPLAGYLLVAQRLLEGDVTARSGWNFGPPAEEIRPVSWIAARFAELWGPGASWSSDPDQRHPHETHCLRLDASKAREHLGWESRLSLDSALDWIVDWYRGLRDGDDAAELCRRDIARYEALGPVASLQQFTPQPTVL